MDDKNKGFTLIELIISIGLMSGIIYSSYSSLTKIIRSKKLVEQNRKTLLIANAVISRMILEIQKISKEKHLLDPEKKVFLLGQSDSLFNFGAIHPNCGKENPSKLLSMLCVAGYGCT